MQLDSRRIRVWSIHGYHILVIILDILKFFPSICTFIVLQSENFFSAFREFILFSILPSFNKNIQVDLVEDEYLFASLLARWWGNMEGCFFSSSNALSLMAWVCFLHQTVVEFIWSHVDKTSGKRGFCNIKNDILNLWMNRVVYNFQDMVQFIHRISAVSPLVDELMEMGLDAVSIANKLKSLPVNEWKVILKRGNKKKLKVKGERRLISSNIVSNSNYDDDIMMDIEDSRHSTVASIADDHTFVYFYKDSQREDMMKLVSTVNSLLSKLLSALGIRCESLEKNAFLMVDSTLDRQVDSLRLAIQGTRLNHVCKMKIVGLYLDTHINNLHILSALASRIQGATKAYLHILARHKFISGSDVIVVLEWVLLCHVRLMFLQLEVNFHKEFYTPFADVMVESIASILGLERINDIFRKTILVSVLRSQSAECVAKKELWRFILRVYFFEISTCSTTRHISNKAWEIINTLCLNKCKIFEGEIVVVPKPEYCPGCWNHFLDLKTDVVNGRI